jgi:hypothetical protein
VLFTLTLCPTTWPATSNKLVRLLVTLCAGYWQTGLVCFPCAVVRPKLTLVGAVQGLFQYVNGLEQECSSRGPPSLVRYGISRGSAAEGKKPERQHRPAPSYRGQPSSEAQEAKPIASSPTK